MHSRRALRTWRRRPASRARVWGLCLIAAGGCALVLVIGYAVMPAHGERAVEVASVGAPGAAPGDSGWGSVGAPGAAPGDSGWGRGGYPMMPGPDGPGSSWSSPPSQQAPGFAANAVAMTSQNWAGYVSAGGAGTFTGVSASWAEPAVTCTAADTFASFWVGLDGDGTDTVEQTGTEADCDGGAAAYQGWFEMFPAAPVFYDNPVEPGDAMSASVTASGGGAFTLTLTDSTQGWTQTTSQTSDTAQLGSAEVIAEAPSDQTTLPLSDFGTVNFTDATADNGALGNQNPAALTLVSADGVTEAAPSALTGGNAFTVTWESNGITTAAALPPAATAPAPWTGIAPGRHHHQHWFGG
jgi:Peptidase A4 family